MFAFNPSSNTYEFRPAAFGNVVVVSGCLILTHLMFSSQPLLVWQTSSPTLLPAHRSKRSLLMRCCRRVCTKHILIQPGNQLTLTSWERVFRETQSYFWTEAVFFGDWATEIRLGPRQSHNCQPIASSQCSPPSTHYPGPDVYVLVYFPVNNTLEYDFVSPGA